MFLINTRKCHYDMIKGILDSFGKNMKTNFVLNLFFQVNSFFAIAVFLGLAFSPPLPANQVATSLAPPKAECYVAVNTYRAVILWEVLSFACFLFSTLVAHGFKLFIVLGAFPATEENKVFVSQHFFHVFWVEYKIDV